MKLLKRTGSGGGVYRRKDSSRLWLWFIDKDGKQQFRSSGTSIKTQAYVELNRILTKIQKGEKVEKRFHRDRSIEADLIRELSEQERSRRKAPKTAAMDLPRLQKFFTYCDLYDVRDMDEVTSDVLQGFLRWLPEHHPRISPVTANRYVDAVRGLLPQKVRVVKNRENESIGKEIPQEVFDQIIAQAKEPFRAFLILLAETGLRTGHLCIVRRSWIRTIGKRRFIDFPADKINARKKAPILPLADTAIKIIDSLVGPVIARPPKQSHLSSPEKNQDWLFEDDSGDQLYTSARIHELWRQIRHRLGHNYRPHDVRHTFAVREIMRTGNLAYVQQMLGHSTPVTTLKIYQRLSTVRLAELIDGANPSGITLKSLLK